MRILIITLLLVSSFMVVAQNFNPPLAGNEPDVRGMDIHQTIQTLDEYWDSVPDEQKMAKSSGYKIYQRWKYLREMEIKPDGTLMTGDDFKNYAKQNITCNTETVEWESIGPYSHEYVSLGHGIGRINVIAVDPTNTNTYYAGAPDGGLWKTTDDGGAWSVFAEDLPTIGISGIAIDPNDSNIIYISTGDEDGLDVVGTGVYKTTDGGVTWSYIGLGDSRWCGDIYIHPDNSDCLYVCSFDGLYKTLDGGETWDNLTPSKRVKEFRFKPDDPSVFYAMITDYGDWELRKYTNGGVDFTVLYSDTDLIRLAFDIAPSNVDYIYILRGGFSSQRYRLLKSTDGGENFVEVNSSDNQSLNMNQTYYNMAIAIAEHDPNVVVIGGVSAYKSEDGGVSFGSSLGGPITSGDYLHADIHHIKFHEGRLYFATDGGVGVSDDLGEIVVDKSFGLGVSQFYRVDVAQESDTKIAGGLQDNSGRAYNGETWISYGVGDGMDTAIEPIYKNQAYCLYQWGGGPYLYSFSQDEEIFYSNNPSGGAWLVPLEFASDGSLYAGYSNVYKKTWNGWEVYNDSFNEYIEQIKTDPFAPEKLLVVSHDGLDVYKVTSTTKEELNVPGNPYTPIITNVAYNQDIEGTIYITTKEKVYKSNDYGETFEDITFGLEPAGNFVDIIHHKDSPNNSLYVISTRGVYYKNDTMAEWMHISDGLPNVHLMDIEVNYVENYLVLATYGRGVFRAATPSLSLDAIDLAKDNDAVIYPNPTADAIMLKKPINEEVIVNISTVDGKLIRQKKYNQFNVDDKVSLLGLEVGTYIITFKSERHLITKKVIKY